MESLGSEMILSQHLVRFAWPERVHAMVGRGASSCAGLVLGMVWSLKGRLTARRCVDTSLLKSLSGEMA